MSTGILYNYFTTTPSTVTTAAASANLVGVFALTSDTGATDTATYTGQLGISGNHWWLQSTGTTLGAWAGNLINFAGIINVGNSTGMPVGQSFTSTFNLCGNVTDAAVGNSDSRISIANWNISPTNSGASYMIQVMNGADAGSGITSVVDAVGLGFTHCPSNRCSSLMNGWGQITLNNNATFNKGFAIMSPGAATFDSGNYSYFVLDTVNHLSRVPVWNAGVYQPLDINYVFTISAPTHYPTIGDTYSNNGVTYSIISASGTTLTATGPSAPTASGTLTLVKSPSGTQPDASITFSKVGQTWVFTVNGVVTPPSAGDTYTNNGVTYTIKSTSLVSGAGTITAVSGVVPGTPTVPSTGTPFLTLTRTSGAGDATISYGLEATTSVWADAITTDPTAGVVTIPNTLKLTGYNPQLFGKGPPAIKIQSLVAYGTYGIDAKLADHTIVPSFYLAFGRWDAGSTILGMADGGGGNAFNGVNTCVGIGLGLDDFRKWGGNTLTVLGSLASVIVTKTSGYTLTANDFSVIFNGTSLTATLPTASGTNTSGTGRIHSIRNQNATALTVAAAGGSINGATSLAQNAFAIYMSDGTNWYQIG